MRFLLPLGIAILAAGCAATPQDIARADAERARDQARLEKRLAGWVPGTPTTCVLARNANVEIYGDTLVYDDRNRLYRTQTTGGCFGLKRDDIIVTRSFDGGQLCRGDIVRTVDRSAGFPSGACSFGDFVPYTRDRRR